MRILYFSRDYTPHDHRFLTALAGAEHQVAYLRLERKGRQLEDRPVPAAVEQIGWRGGRKPFGWTGVLSLCADLCRVLAEVKPDLVHAGPVPNVAFLVALAGFKPLVSMSWGSDLLYDIDRNRWLNWTARFALRRTAVLVGDCQAVRLKAEALGYCGEQVVLFPWGVDLKQFKPGLTQDLRQRQGWQDAFVLLSMRNWEPIYGVETIARAFVRAARCAPELRLVLMGNGSQAALLRRVFEQGDVLDRVYFAGQVSNDDLPRFYSAADVYLSASHSDGSSVSLMEALACGKPALVSDIPGNREWVSPEIGWTFPAGDETALADRILQALQQQARLTKMGATARALAEQRADWQRNFQELLRAYQMAVEMNR